MKLAFLSFTGRGEALARQLSEILGGTVWRCNAPMGLKEWTQVQFRDSEALVYIGAVGIAVRAIAPHLQSKVTDPAVVAVDECAQFAIPLVSGHLGGANDLARRISRACGATAVITTATDVNDIFSVDAWARYQNCRVWNPKRIKTVSAKLLAGERIGLATDWPVRGEPPKGVCLTGLQEADVQVIVYRNTPQEALVLVPHIAVLGVGCRKETSAASLEDVLNTALELWGIYPQAICAVSSIDLKKDEPGLLAFCQSRGWPLHTFSAEALRGLPGEFTVSPFVERVTGVDNVCERSAVLASGGVLLKKKYAANGVTMALALRPYTLDWRWKDE